MKSVKKNSKPKEGAISKEEERGQHAMAIKLLSRVKENPIEKQKVAVRIDSKTIVLMSRKKADKFKSQLKANII